MGAVRLVPARRTHMTTLSMSLSKSTKRKYVALVSTPALCSVRRGSRSLQSSNHGGDHAACVILMATVSCSVLAWRGPQRRCCRGPRAQIPPADTSTALCTQVRTSRRVNASMHPACTRESGHAPVTDVPLLPPAETNAHVERTRAEPSHERVAKRIARVWSGAARDAGGHGRRGHGAVLQVMRVHAPLHVAAGRVSQVRTWKQRAPEPVALGPPPGRSRRIWNEKLTTKIE